MADIVFLAIVVAFFAVAAGFVVLCDRIIGPANAAATAAPTPLRPVEAPSAEAA